MTAVYAGLRAATEHSDYQISHHPDLRYVCLGGIRSTGLTAAMALAEEALARLAECGLPVTAQGDGQHDPDDTTRRDRRAAVPARRSDRVPLRASDCRRSHRGLRSTRPGCRLRRVASSHQSVGRALPRVLLPGRTVRPHRVERGPVTASDRRVAIVGAGPVGTLCSHRAATSGDRSRDASTSANSKPAASPATPITSASACAIFID